MSGYSCLLDNYLRFLPLSLGNAMDPDLKAWVDEQEQLKTVGRVLDGKELLPDEESRSQVNRSGIAILIGIAVLVILFSIMLCFQNQKAPEPAFSVATATQKAGVPQGIVDAHGRVQVAVIDMGKGVIPPGAVKVEGNIHEPGKVTYVMKDGTRMTVTNQ